MRGFILAGQLACALGSVLKDLAEKRPISPKIFEDVDFKAACALEREATRRSVAMTELG